MSEFGLKIWSTNINYYNCIINLYEKKIFNFLEIYYVPNSLETINLWKMTNIPIIVHGTHLEYGFNLSDRDLENYNSSILKEIRFFTDNLNARYIILHSEANGDIDETVRQLLLFNDERVLIENVPAIVFGEDLSFIGAKPNEIKFIIEEANVGFVLDIGHAIAAAIFYDKDYFNYIKEFNILAPEMYHLSDTDTRTPYDDHLNIGEGNLNFRKIFKIINIEKKISLETRKKSMENLDDFEKDIILLKKIIE